MDGPLRPTQRSLAEPFEIKVYEIDDVERLQRRRSVGNKVRVNSSVFTALLLTVLSLIVVVPSGSGIL